MHSSIDPLYLPPKPFMLMEQSEQEYFKLIGVTGVNGLYQLVGNRTDGAILKNIEDGSKKFFPGRLHTFSYLRTIEIFTVEDNIGLLDLFILMEESGKETPVQMEALVLKEYFAEVCPMMDFDRVKVSDMKKIVKWYNCIQQSGIQLPRQDKAPAPENP